MRKYFGMEAKKGFTNKVQWLNRQKGLHDLTPDLLPVAATSRNSVGVNIQAQSRMRLKYGKKKKQIIKSKPFKLKCKSRGNLGNLSTLHAARPGGGRLRSDSIGSVSSLGSSSVVSTIQGGISNSRATKDQLIFDDQSDLDADVYVNHMDYNKGASLDIENLLHHLSTEKGKKDYKNKLILDAMYKREEEATDLIANVRACTPDVSAIPSQVSHSRQLSGPLIACLFLLILTFLPKISC